MRRIYLLFAITFLSASMLMAHDLTPDEAWKRVIAVYGGMPTRALSTTNVSPRLLSTVNMSDSTPAYYVFVTEEGTVFSSADDVAAPVLGYTDKAVDDTTALPPALSYMLGTYVKEIEWAKTNGVSASYSRTQASDMSSIEPLVETTWDQGAPYNNLCPLKDGDSTYTGCAATAMAQAMYYFKYPEVGEGTISYEWNGQTLELDLSESPIQWDNMLLSYPSPDSGTEEERSAIASFMRDCGYALHMAYGTKYEGGSAAYAKDIPLALINNYGYDKGISLVARDFYSTEQWEQMIYDELAASRPIVYTGEGDGGGHAFVCDGYLSDGLFHMNWGWSGEFNGYYALSALNPDGLGAGGGTGEYNSYQIAVIGIQTPQEGSQVQIPFVGSLTSVYALSEDYDLLIIPEDDIFGGDGVYANFGYDEATFTIGVKLVNVEDESEIYIGDEDFTDVVWRGNEGCYGISVTIPSETPLGKYMAYPVYKCAYNGEEGDWTEVWLPYGAAEYVSLEVTESGVEIDTDVEVLDIDVPDTLMVGEEFSFDIIIHNTLDEETSFYYKATLYDNEEDMNVLAELGEIEGTIPADDENYIVSIENTLDDSLEWYDDIEVPGEYVIGIEDDNHIENYFYVLITDNTTVIESVGADTVSQNNRVYDLSGREVTSLKPAAGIYILRSGNKTRKVVIK